MKTFYGLNSFHVLSLQNRRLISYSVSSVIVFSFPVDVMYSYCTRINFNQNLHKLNENHNLIKYDEKGTMLNIGFKRIKPLGSFNALKFWKCLPSEFTIWYLIS